VRVVDDHAQRIDGGQIRAQPVEAVQDRKRGIDTRRVPLIHRGRAWKTEQGGRLSRSGLQQIGALELGCFGERGFEKLTHHSEGELPLQFGPTRAKHPHSEARSRRPRRLEQSRLPYSSRPFDHNEPPASAAGLCQRRFDPRQLLAPLEQRSRGRGPSHMRRAYAHSAEKSGGLHGANHGPGPPGSGHPIPSSVTSSWLQED